MPVTAPPTRLSTGGPNWDIYGNVGVAQDFYTQGRLAFACRAWVNFNGTGTVAVRAGGNVSSITDLGTGDYQMNFTTAMIDANYAAVMALDGMTLIPLVRNYATTSVRLTAAAGNNVQVDMLTVSASIFR